MDILDMVDETPYLSVFYDIKGMDIMDIILDIYSSCDLWLSFCDYGVGGGIRVQIYRW